MSNEEETENKATPKAILLRYGIAIAAEIALLFGYFGLVGLFSETSLVTIYKKLSDGFLVVGILAFGAGLLVYFSTLGAFNFLSFTALKIASKFAHRMPIATMSYGDYVNSKKKSDAKFGYLLITGGVFLVLCVIFIFLFYSVYVPPETSLSS